MSTMVSNKVRTLVIEDLEIAQVAAENLLEELNSEVNIASSASQAFEQLFSNHFDIIFIDINLPDLDGFEIASTIRMMQRSSKRIPLIAVTANSSEDLEAKTKRSGFDDFLIKPLTLEAVRHVMFKHLNRTD